MLIDWFTTAAQAVNFLILVWLLKHFLYKPILNAIDAREKKIAAELADAAAKKAEAQRDRDEFQHKNEAFDLQRAALLAKAIDEAKTERGRLLDEAQKAADSWTSQRQQALQVDAHNLNQAIAHRAQQEVFAIARKALSDLATASLEERLTAVFTRRLQEMDDHAKAEFGQSLTSATRPAIVRTAFELPEQQRAFIQNALNVTFSADIPLRFEVSPDLISGIELASDGQKVSWSIAAYLTALEQNVDDLHNSKKQPITKATPQRGVTVELKPPINGAPEAKVAATPEAATPTLETKHP